MAEEFIRKRLRPAVMARTMSKRDMSCDITNEVIEEKDKFQVVDGGSMARKDVLLKDVNIHLEGDQITKPLEFLHYCGVCGRQLGLERDIYIYRGESAFCSIECREKQIRFDATRSNLS